MEIHYVAIGLMRKDLRTGEVYSASNNNRTIGNCLQFETLPLILKDSDYPNTSDYPDIKTYLEREAADGFQPVQLANNFVITGSGVGGTSTKKTIFVVGPTTYTVQVGDDIIKVDATAGAVVVNLPAIATWPGAEIDIKKADLSSNGVQIIPHGTETIDLNNDPDNLPPVTITTHKNSFHLVNDGGTDWTSL